MVSREETASQPNPSRQFDVRFWSRRDWRPPRDRRILAICRASAKMGRPESADTTPGQRVCRGWMNENISGFMAAKSKLEEAFLERERRRLRAIMRAILLFVRGKPSPTRLIRAGRIGPGRTILAPNG